MSAPRYALLALLVAGSCRSNPEEEEEPQLFEVHPIAVDGHLAAFLPAFQKYALVFDIPIVATSATPDTKVWHAANVLAQYLDNDENGMVEDSRVLEALHTSGAYLAMAATEGEMEQLGVDREGLRRAGFYTGQDLYGEEALPDGAPHVEGPGRFDATLEEVLHLVSFGWARAHSYAFAFEPGSRLANAMDAARGGQFMRVPRRYPADAWYTYYDSTCDYGCQVAEYFYWVLTSLLGAQDYPGRSEEIVGEWQLNTLELVKARDAAAWDLFTDMRFRFPRVRPDGKYGEELAGRS